MNRRNQRNQRNHSPSRVRHVRYNICIINDATVELMFTSPPPGPKGRVQFQSVSADGEDDAYDFNTDFK